MWRVELIGLKNDDAAPETNTAPLEITLEDGTELSLKPGVDIMPVDIMPSHKR